VERSMNVTETLAELVAINSVSSVSNREIIRYLTRRLEAQNLHLHLYSYIDPSGQEKTNLVAIAAPDMTAYEQVELALVGHYRYSSL
jgi:acetylornithine deacetylase/succinyl-diaminopimelate desuccinylase-like protein